MTAEFVLTKPFLPVQELATLGVLSASARK